MTCSVLPVTCSHITCALGSLCPCVLLSHLTSSWAISLPELLWYRMAFGVPQYGRGYPHCWGVCQAASWALKRPLGTPSFPVTPGILTQSRAFCRTLSLWSGPFCLRSQPAQVYPDSLQSLMVSRYQEFSSSALKTVELWPFIPDPVIS